MTFSGKVKELEGNSFSYIARNLNIPISSAKLVLKRLRSYGLISFEKQVPVRLTPLGKSILKILGGDKHVS